MHLCSPGLMTNSCAAACFRAVSASVPLVEEICPKGNNTVAFQRGILCHHFLKAQLLSCYGVYKGFSADDDQEQGSSS